jgi:nucleotide-binding universal stress UspA family protein
MAFKKILCPTDFSQGSAQALRSAARMANVDDAELTIAHAWFVPPSAFAGELPYPAYVLQDMIDDAQKGLEATMADARALGVKRVNIKLLTGVPWAEITQMIDNQGYDLAVVGTHGRTGISRIMLGSVAEKIVRHAPCSVLAVRPDSEPKPYQHILVPIDFSESAEIALEQVDETIRPGGAGVTLLHVVEIPVSYAGEPPVLDFARDLDKRSAEMLDTWAARLRSNAQVNVTTRSRIGRAGAEILAVLDTDPSFDAVVMGSHGRTGLKRALLGSVAEKVIRHAPCPVLVARRH